MLIGLGRQIPAGIDELIAPGLAARLDRLDLLSRKLLAGKLPGERRGKRRGRSVEFDDYRTYVAGDDLRTIDWNVYARLDRLFVKIFREEEDLALHLIVDASPSMDAGDPNKMIFAHRLAMALGYIGLVNQNRVTCAAIGLAPSERGGVEFRVLAPLRGRPNLRRLSGFLLGTLREAATRGPGVGGSNFSGSIRSLAMSRAGRGIVVVISDFLIPEEGGARRALNYLAGSEIGGFDTYCLQVLSPGELDPAREAERGLMGDLRLSDVETGRAMEVTISPALLARYRANFNAYQERLRTDCHARGIAHFLVPTTTAIDALVITSLRRGGMLR